MAVTRELREGETRCAVTPETVKKFVALGAVVTIEAGTGAGSSFPDADYVAAGAVVKSDIHRAPEGADILLKVRGPTAHETSGPASNLRLGASHREPTPSKRCPRRVDARPT